MTDLQATPAELNNASHEVRSAADSLDHRIASLTSRVHKLLDNGWKGQAADAFREDWEKWLHGAKDVVGGLDTTAGLLNSAATSYSKRDSANATSIDRGAGGLNMDA